MVTYKVKQASNKLLTTISKYHSGDLYKIFNELTNLIKTYENNINTITASETKSKITMMYITHNDIFKGQFDNDINTRQYVYDIIDNDKSSSIAVSITINSSDDTPILNKQISAAIAIWLRRTDHKSLNEFLSNYLDDLGIHYILYTSLDNLYHTNIIKKHNKITYV